MTGKLAPSIQMRLVAKFLAPSLVFALAACSGASGPDESLAQCKMEFQGQTGAKYRTEFIKRHQGLADTALQPEAIANAARDSFMLTCMKLKGFTFADQLDGSGKLNKECWSRNPRDNMPASPKIDSASCFSR